MYCFFGWTYHTISALKPAKLRRRNFGAGFRLKSASEKSAAIIISKDFIGNHNKKMAILQLVSELQRVFQATVDSMELTCEGYEGLVGCHE
jgi:hypothetical protein